jgi:hypothetical protein
VLGILEAMPGIPRDEDRGSLFEGMLHVVESHDAAAFQNPERFVHFEMSVDRNARTGHHLLRPQSNIRRSRSRSDLNKDIPPVAKVNEMLAVVASKDSSRRSRRPAISNFMRKHLAHAQTSYCKEK